MCRDFSNASSASSAGDDESGGEGRNGGRGGNRWTSRQTRSSWGGHGQWRQGCSGPDRKRARTDRPASQWFCNLCNKDLKQEERYNWHMEHDHVSCTEPGCSWRGPEFALVAHRLKHVVSADGQSVVDSPEEIQAWRKLRRANWPSKSNLEKKSDVEGRRQQLGALSNEQSPKPGMLEQLLRKAHGLDRRGGGWWYGGGKSKGKDKGSGKGKGKMKGKGKDSKSKGKGKSKGSWGWQAWGEPADGKGKAMGDDNVDRTHALVAVALPSMLANCVPLEAPGGGQRVSEPAPRWTRNVCKYFAQGFCYHGANCRYEHPTSNEEHRPGVERQSVEIQSEGWQFRLLPSTLANRACLRGEGPAADMNRAVASVGPDAAVTVMQRVEPCLPPPGRQRRTGLLRRLLQREVTNYHSAILQCVRYVVATDFFRLERAPLPDHAPRQPRQESQRDEAGVEEEHLDDADIMELADVLV